MLEALVMLLLVTTSSQNVVVTVQGRLRGVSHEGYVSYTGIPYGTVNMTGGQFKRAGLAPFWLGIREAAQPTCSSASRVEECLRLDVHVPSHGSTPWPVLAWVRGVSGQYNPGKLVQQGIIVVVIYHRLGPPGFLCLNDEKIPGNAGLKDVTAALRWIRDNIVAFRGNPAKVVVAGQSFGAAMVQALTLSPIAVGLYHGVILQSGTALSPWSFNYDAGERAQLLANTLSDEDDVASVLANANTSDLVDNSENLDLPYFPFGICVEKEYKKEEQLLSEAPFALLTAKKVNSVPLIAGYNSDEAYIFAYTLKQAKVMMRLAKDVDVLLPEELKFLNHREVGTVAKQVKDTYFKNNITMASVLAYHSDAYFISHIHRSVRLHASASHAPVYYYQFSFTGGLGVEPEPGVKKTGAAHSDELAYLFSDGAQFDGDDKDVQTHLLKLWSNFVKYLNPTPSGQEPRWDAVDPDNPRVLDISTALHMRPFPHTRATHMWDDIYDKYYYGRQS